MGASKSQAPAVNANMLTHLIQKSNANRSQVLPCSLSTACHGEMEARMVSAISVNLLKEHVCNKDPNSEECAAFTRAAAILETNLKPPCGAGSMKCTKSGDTLCVANMCKEDIDNLPEE